MPMWAQEHMHWAEGAIPCADLSVTLNSNELWFVTAAVLSHMGFRTGETSHQIIRYCVNCFRFCWHFQNKGFLTELAVSIFIHLTVIKRKENQLWGRKGLFGLKFQVSDIIRNIKARTQRRKAPEGGTSRCSTQHHHLWLRNSPHTKKSVRNRGGCCFLAVLRVYALPASHTVQSDLLQE